MPGSLGHSRLALLAVIQPTLQVVVLLLGLLAQFGIMVGKYLHGFCLLQQIADAAVECQQLVSIMVAQLACTARNEVVAYGSHRVGVPLGCHLLAVDQPVYLALQSQGEAPAHVCLDMQGGRYVQLVELLIAVCSHQPARNGQIRAITDYGIGPYGHVGSVLRQGVAHPHAVLVAACEGAAHACSQPDVEPLCLAVGPKLHEVELHSELHVVRVHQIVAICLGRNRPGIQFIEALLAAIA